MKKNNYWSAIVFMAGKGCGLVVFALALLASPAQAECRSWDVSGDWYLKGAGEFYAFHLTQKIYAITGLATMGTAQSVKVTGTVTGSSFYLLLSAKGFELRGEIGADGTIHGIVHDLNNPNKKLAFVSSRAMKCADRIASPAPPPKPVATAPTSTVAPKISASPTVVTIPDGQSQGTVTLTWDGGPDHPYAEVWIKVDNQDETFVVEQGKGSRRVTVELGKTYLYILTDAGKRLATVAVTAK